MTNAANQKDALAELRKEFKETRLLREIQDEEVFHEELCIAMNKAIETGMPVAHPRATEPDPALAPSGDMYNARQLQWGCHDAELRIKKLKRQVQMINPSLF